MEAREALEEPAEWAALLVLVAMEAKAARKPLALAAMRARRRAEAAERPLTKAVADAASLLRTIRRNRRHLPDWRLQQW